MQYIYLYILQEGMLNSLQNHVEQEENRWSEQVQILQAELSAITEERNSLLLKTKVKSIIPTFFKTLFFNSCLKCDYFIQQIQNGCNENNSNCEQKVNGNNKCSALLAASAIKQSTVNIIKIFFLFRMFLSLLLIGIYYMNNKPQIILTKNFPLNYINLRLYNFFLN